MIKCGYPGKTPILHQSSFSCSLVEFVKEDGVKCSHSTIEKEVLGYFLGHFLTMALMFYLMVTISKQVPAEDFPRSLLPGSG